MKTLFAELWRSYPLFRIVLVFFGVAMMVLTMLFPVSVLLTVRTQSQPIMEECPLSQVKMSATKTSANIFENIECQREIVMAYGYRDKDGKRPTINANKGALTILVSDDTIPHSREDLIVFDVSGYDLLTANVVGWGDNVGGTSELIIFRDGNPVPVHRYRIGDYLISGTKALSIDVSGWNTLSIDAVSPDCVPELIVAIANPILCK